MPAPIMVEESPIILIDLNLKIFLSILYSTIPSLILYPLSLNPSATLYGLVFAEGGNCWSGKDTFNPFDLYRSAGVGVRIFLPMFGKLGVDWGYGFDDVPGRPSSSGSQFHFIIGQNF